MLKDPGVAEAIRTHNWKDLRSAIAEATAREVLLAEYGGNAQVFTNLEVVRRVQAKTVAEYQAAQQALGIKPDPGKLRYKGTQIVGEVISEIDVLVAERGAGGKLSPVELVEVKARQSSSMTGAKAAAEVAQKVTRLDQLRTGKPGDVLLTTRSEYEGDRYRSHQPVRFSPVLHRSKEPPWVSPGRLASLDSCRTATKCLRRLQNPSPRRATPRGAADDSTARVRAIHAIGTRTAREGRD